MEERPPWAFTRLLAARVGEVSSLLDLQTGGGEILSEVLGRATRVPGRVAATEPWPPNAIVARHALARFHADLIEVSNDAPLPFGASSFELVTSRHPVVVQWDEIARVLEPGGSYLAQHVGPGTNREVTDFLMGPQPVSEARSPQRAVLDAEANGLELVRLEEATLRVEFYDIGALVYFLRLVPWTVPRFTTAVYEPQLRRLHDAIVADGRFTSHSTRFLIELRKPPLPH
jgi:SAM-dependent methyltransferase